MARLGLITGALLMVAGTAHAQDTSNGEFSVGWRYYHATLRSAVDSIGVDLPNDYPKGWYADVAMNLSPKFAVVVEAGGTYHKEETSTTSGFLTIDESAELTFHAFMGGIRVRAPQHEAFVPFGQVLFGGQHDTSSYERTTTFSITGNPSILTRENSTSSAVLALDGGVTAAAGAIGVRAAVGYVRFFSAADADAFRLSLGAVLRF